MTSFRTDRNNNPTAFTTDLAVEGQLPPDEWYKGDAFEAGGHTYYTAKLLKDPIDTTIKLIDRVGFYTTPPHQRWTYIGIPIDLWHSLTYEQKVKVIGFMYGQEGGMAMKHYFSTPVPINVQVSDTLKLGDALR